MKFLMTFYIKRKSDILKFYLNIIIVSPVLMFHGWMYLFLPIEILKGIIGKLMRLRLQINLIKD